MVDVDALLIALKRQYPLPPINPTWFRQCAQDLVDAGEQVTLEEMTDQYLYTDLSASTLPLPNLLPKPEAHNINLYKTPTTLQIQAITEISSSAFQLHTTYEQRRDILEGHTAIRRMDDDPEDDSGGEEEEKIPNYPRGMLKLEVGDGRGGVRAIEYRKIGELVLGNTTLGTKVGPGLGSAKIKILVQNVRVLRGVLLLTPENTQVLGGSVEALQKNQQKHFIAGLLGRMGKPNPDDDEGLEPTEIARPPRASTQRPPTRTNTTRNNVQDPITIDDDDDFDFDDSLIRHVDEVEARAVRMAGPSGAPSGNKTASAETSRRGDSPKKPRTKGTTASTSSRSTTQPMFKGKFRAVDDDRHSLLLDKSNSVPAKQEDIPSDDFDFDDSFIQYVDEVGVYRSSGSRSGSGSRPFAEREVIEISD